MSFYTIQDSGRKPFSQENDSPRSRPISLRFAETTYTKLEKKAVKEGLSKYLQSVLEEHAEAGKTRKKD